MPNKLKLLWRGNNRYSLGYFWYVLSTMLRQADTLTIRLMLAIASLGFGITVLYQPVIFANNPGYHRAHQMAPHWVWATVYILHFVGVIWRIWDIKSRPYCALLVNATGFGVWTLMTLSLNVSLGAVTPGTSLEWTVVFFSGWALYRTGIKSESFSQ